MKPTSFQFTEIFPELFIYHGAVNTGILIWGERALLIDCDDTLTPARLAELGIQRVERIYCTQHRRPNTAGIPIFNSEVYVPQGEVRQFEEATSYWQDWRNRWHLYHFRPGSLAPLQDIAISGVVTEGDMIQWGDFTLQVVDTPGMTDGAVSYRVEVGSPKQEPRVVIFSGDVINAAGQVWDVHSLQKNKGTWLDYHGFLGAVKTLIDSLVKLGETTADCLIPSHGDVITDHPSAIKFTVARLETLYRNYIAISALNFYFPHLFQDLRDDSWRIAPASVMDFPDFIQPVTATSFAIHSDSGGLFLIDCGHDSVLDTLTAWKEQGQYTQLEGCWITHYHDDHVDALHHLAAFTPSIPIYADEHLAEILTHPARFYLPCISPASAPVTHITTDGETWRWHDFELTALHFPGQTYYHGGLVLRGHGKVVLFCGDSFAPTGLDDYTAGNRNFLGAGRGYQRCLDQIRQYHPDLILNQHQQQAFHFGEEQVNYLEQMLIAREALLKELLPWEDANYGTDAGWLRAYPYESVTCPGACCTLEVQATVHTDESPRVVVAAVTPPGWESQSLHPEAFTTGEVQDERIVHSRLSITVPPGTVAGCYPVAFRVIWNECYLGQVCHALVRVW